MAGKPGTKVMGHVDLVNPTMYFKAADLMDRDVTIEIVDVVWEQLTMAGGKKDTKPAAIVRSTKTGKVLEKKWIIGSKTVQKQIAAACGEKHVERWSGKRVTMYPTTCKGQGGEVMECIRVRSRVNSAPASADVPEGMAASPEPDSGAQS